LKIVHFTSVHPLSDTRIFVKQCCSLEKQGIETILIGCGDFDSVKSGVKIKVIPKRKGFLKRLFLTDFAITKKALAENADLYHFHDPELIPFAILMRLLGEKVVFDAHEDLSLQISNKVWLPKLLRKPLAYFARFLYWLADKTMSGIVTVTPTLIRLFKNKNTVLVRNFPDLGEFTKVEVDDINERGNHAVYVGGVTKVRGLKENILAINNVTPNLNAKLLVGGTFQSQDFEDEINALDLKSTDFKGWLSRDEVQSLLSQAKIGLVTLHPTANYYDAYPVKMFEYMAAGLPVIASDFPVYREIIEKANCGILVDPLKPKEISEAIESLLCAPDVIIKYARNGRKAAMEYYNWQHEANQLVSLYQQILL